MNSQLFAQLKLSKFPLFDPACPPTCAELIAACGNDLAKVGWERHSAEWTAYSVAGMPCTGQTPEDALANFWLSTNRQLARYGHLVR
jgi:hypothetical protein